MKKVLILSCLIVSGCGSGIKTVVKENFKNDIKIAVMPFAGKDGETGLSLAEEFTTYLMEAGFDAVERSQLENILKEQKISASGFVDTAAMAEIGKLAGVNVVVTGSYRVRKKETKTIVPQPAPFMPAKRPLKKPLPPKDKPEIRVDVDTVFSGINVKFVDVNTGKILLSSSAEKEYDADSVNRALKDIAVSIKEALEKNNLVK